MNWFDVDKEGLAKLVEKRGRGFVINELLQNAWDCDGVTKVAVKLEPVAGRPLARLVVEDDHPDGFANLAHSYTLFAESNKKVDPAKRGRFNLGEKLVLSLCEEATIESTRGTVSFGPSGRRERRGRARMKGTSFSALLRMTRDQFAAIEAEVERLIPPIDIETTYNGRQLGVGYTRRASFAGVKLWTEIAETDGILRRRLRETTVSLYERKAGEQAMLYEMGIPVVALDDDPYHVDVGQKVLLNMERDSVIASYLSLLRAEIANRIHSDLTEEQASGKWATEAMAEAGREALVSLNQKRHGERAVIADMSDREAENKLKGEGYTVVSGGSYPAEVWQRLKEMNVMAPAGQVAPTPRPFSPTGKPLKVIPLGDWTMEMKRFGRFAADMARECAGIRVLAVEMVDDRGWGFAGAYSRVGNQDGHLYVNVASHPKDFLDTTIAAREKQVDFLIHELAHHHGHHLEAGYHEALCRIGARVFWHAMKRSLWIYELAE
jgi:hypothetical protein